MMKDGSTLIMKKKVTLADIAAACGTSTVTVSKALADKSGVGEEMRRKIKETAESMGYISARSPFGLKNENVCVIVPSKFINPNGSFYWALYNSLVVRLKKDNMYSIMENLSEEDERDLVLPKLVTENKVAAVISLGQLSPEYAEKLIEARPETLLLDYYIPEITADSIVTNGYSGGYKLTAYLISQGHKNIGFIGSRFATSSIFDRYMGYLKAMIANGLEVRSDWTIDDRDDSRDFIEFDFPKEMPTAFVCNCDEAAYRAIKQLKSMGYDVPGDISVVGYDNYLISEVSEPSITTINVDSEYMADIAVSAVEERMLDPNGVRRTRTIDGDLVIKNSVKNIG